MSDDQFSGQQGQYAQNPFATTAPSKPSGPKTTRNRQPVSCRGCRKSKLKCDRQRPCEACVRRGFRDRCYYEATKVVPRKKRRTAASHSAHARLRNLEVLVMQIQATDPSKATQISSVMSAGQPESHTPNEGHIIIQGNASSYVGSTYWSAILDNIQELKNVIVSEDVSDDGRTDELDLFDPDTLFLFSAPRPSSFEKVLEVLPPKSQVDRYMSVYFKTDYLVLPVIHQGRFQRQYEDFWRDPLRSPPLWTSILFSILVTAATVNLMNQSKSMEEEYTRRDEFLGAAAQCLIIGNYGKPQEYVLEALILYAQTKYVASLDPSREVAVILSLVFRFAFEMGYHRDPEHFPHITIFQGEMRRRLWAICRQIDLLQAFQLGLPMYIPHDAYDTKPFSNLADSDFDEESTYLPPSRPETEPTRISQFSVKCRVIVTFSQAFCSSISLKPISIDKVMELDREVREAHGTVPPSLQTRPIAGSFTENSSVIMARIEIELLFRKTLCSLHRKPMTAGNSFSREVCRESAMSILIHLVDLSRELQPQGQLAHDQWPMSCYMMHDFLLSSMLLCLVISQRRKENHPQKAIDESQAEIAMIREAYNAINVLSRHSKEARRVSNVLASMLSSLETNYSNPNSAAPQPKTGQDAAAAVAFPSALLAPPEPRFTFEYDPFENLNSIPEDIDWAFFDQYYLNTNPNMFMYNATGTAPLKVLTR